MANWYTQGDHPNDEPRIYSLKPLTKKEKKLLNKWMEEYQKMLSRIISNEPSK